MIESDSVTAANMLFSTKVCDLEMRKQQIYHPHLLGGGGVGFPQLHLTLLRSPERCAGLRGLGINILIFLDH